MVEKISGKDDEQVVRSGITLIGTDDIHRNPLFAGVDVLQGSGELTGAHWISETGELYGVVALTGTMNVGSVYNCIQRAEMRGKFGKIVGGLAATLDVVGETYDRMTDPMAFPTTGDEELERAIEGMSDGPVREGNTGGGTPMVSFGLKGGTGTSSRIVPAADGSEYTVGVLVQANHGVSYDLTIAGVPVGKVLYEEGYTKPWFPKNDAPHDGLPMKEGDGSIIVIVATDAPLLPHQCKAVARRAGVGIGRGGGGVGMLSGDIFLCFSTATPLTPRPDPALTITPPVATFDIRAVSHFTLDVLFRAAADATEEAILNALFAAEEMDGYSGQRWRTLPVERVKELLEAAGRIPG